jgi:hypothetical protein
MQQQVSKLAYIIYVEVIYGKTMRDLKILINNILVLFRVLNLPIQQANLSSNFNNFEILELF